MKRFSPLLAAMGFGALVFLAGYADVSQVGTALGQGILSGQDQEMLKKLLTQTTKAVRPMADREEYFLGRAVAATILSQYRLYNHDGMTSYVNEVGQAVVLGSDRPYTYGGYHFAILDTDEVNALSCPGGIIFLTRGMMRKLKNEDELAAVLAHEVAHVNHRDGIAAIQRSRWVEVASLLGSEAAKRVGAADLNKLVSLFQGSVDDVVKTLLVNGYSREQESAADQSALNFLNRLGYDPFALPDSLGRLEKEASGGANRGIFATHPGMGERASADTAIISQNRWTRVDNPARDKRFRQMAG